MPEEIKNARIKFSELEYIVMEGGGARGAAYLGAIRGLEIKMIDRFLDANGAIQKHDTGDRDSGLLDFYEDINNKKIPLIKGIAGASAGAITTFALALGFNSKEVKTILEFPFENFLKKAHVGMYRTVRKDGTLGVGQDKKNKFFGHKELQGGVEFKFDFKNDETFVSGNPIKIAKRDLLAGIVVKTITDGLISNFQQMGQGISRWFKIDSPDEVAPFWRGFFRFMFGATGNNFWARVGIARGLRILFFQVLIPTRIIKVPMSFNTNHVMSVFFDRGMYSGFAVREFFMDMLIYAATRKTQFHRGLVKFLEEKKDDELQAEFGSDVLKGDLKREGIAEALLGYNQKFEIGKRFKSGIGRDKKLELTLKCISRLTFKHFREITGINYGACVSNFTTGLPVYFGHEWTPDFRVMEAVAASMSIPPAIRPLYNECDVVKKGGIKEVKNANGTAVNMDLDKIPFASKDGVFELADYYLHEHAVKYALQKLIQKDDNTVVHVNNGIDISAFLPKLREIVVGEYTSTDDPTAIPQPQHTKTVEVEGSAGKIKVDYAMFKFFYNACYKGLFLDGGYRNNIPYNFFRLRNQNIDKVLAIKLDESFPPDLVNDLNSKIKSKLNKIKIPEAVDELQELSREDELIKQMLESMDIEVPDPETKTHRVTRKIIIAEAKKIFDEFLNEWARKKEDATGQEKRQTAALLRKDNKAAKRLAKESLKKFRKFHLSPPWQIPVSMLTLASDGYSFGSEKGQVKQMTDHNQILPLYDYGIGTYDFDMGKVRPMIDLAQDKAQEETMNFFGPEQN